MTPSCSPMTNVTHLECSRCQRRFEAGRPHTLCPCGGPLLVRYDLPSVASHQTRASLSESPANMWRYRALLPCALEDSVVTLGEGFTPLVHARRLGQRYGASRLFIKDEGQNPTGSFKARGLSCAVSMARELGLTRLAVPSAGNAASALAAYAAAAGLEAHVFLPADAPRANVVECRTYGASVTLVPGLLSDCARLVAERAPQEGWFDVSAMKEPYRVEGKKTMGYEVAEQRGWTLPDAILYPTGGGVGLIGMWKAFQEMEQVGWIDGSVRPRMIVVQAAGCQPLVRAFEQGANSAEFFEGAQTLAAGLRVPKPLADSLILEIVRASRGTCLSVTDEEILEGAREMSSTEGILPAPEGAACLPAYRKLLASGFLTPDQSVVLFNTGTGLKYLDVLERPTLTPKGTASHTGGLITPF